MSNTMSQILCVLGEQMSNIDGNVVSSFTCACIDTFNKDENQENHERPQARPRQTT